MAIETSESAFLDLQLVTNSTSLGFSATMYLLYLHIDMLEFRFALHASFEASCCIRPAHNNGYERDKFRPLSMSQLIRA